jgi:hypothetical protein
MFNSGMASSSKSSTNGWRAGNISVSNTSLMISWPFKLRSLPSSSTTRQITLRRSGSNKAAQPTPSFLMRLKLWQTSAKKSSSRWSCSSTSFSMCVLLTQSSPSGFPVYLLARSRSMLRTQSTSSLRRRLLEDERKGMVTGSTILYSPRRCALMRSPRGIPIFSPTSFWFMARQTSNSRSAPWNAESWWPNRSNWLSARQKISTQQLRPKSSSWVDSDTSTTSA